VHILLVSHSVRVGSCINAPWKVFFTVFAAACNIILFLDVGVCVCVCVCVCVYIYTHMEIH
jgi:hypothetical protein